MTDTQEIREALEASTQADWQWQFDKTIGRWCVSPGILITGEDDGTPGGDEIDRANAFLIVNARHHAEEVVQLRDRVEKLEAEKQAAMDHAAAAVETAKRLEVENKALRQAGQAVIEDCANLFGQRDTRAEDWANKLLVDLQYLRALMEDK